MKPVTTPVPIFMLKAFYKTSSNVDLLNPQTIGTLNTNEVKVFDITKKTGGGLVNSPSTVNDTCENYVCQPDNSGMYSIQFVVRLTTETAGAIVHLNSSVIDTLTYQVVSASPQSGYAVATISSKGQVLWNRLSGNPAVLTFVK